MGLFVSQRHRALQQVLHDNLLPDERLLWSAYPSAFACKTRLLSKVGFWAIIFVAALLLFCKVAESFYLYYVVSEDMGFMLHYLLTSYFGLFVLFMTYVCFQFYIDALQTASPYKRYTLYAITNQRVMIVMCLTGNPPAVFSYYPDEITVPEKVKRLDGAGILTFAEPRECKIGHTLPAFPLPGGFIGIFNVEMVATFLRMLQANSFSSARENGSSSVVKR